MQPINIKKIQEVSDKIAKKYNPERIILFGSYAWGKPGPDSDVDLFIVKDTENKRKLTEEINRLIFPRPFPIDILVYTPYEVAEKINKDRNLFLEDIINNGKLLYVRP